MSLLTNMKIGRKQLLCFLLLFVVTTGVSLVSYSRVQQIRHDNAWTRHTYVVLLQLDRLMASMVDQETGIRGYLISGQDHFLDPYRAGGAQFGDSLQQLRQLVHRPSQVAKATRSTTRSCANSAIRTMATAAPTRVPRKR